MSDKIFIIDFEDSFTYNIANILFPFEQNCLVISHREFFRSKVLNLPEHKIAIILGPGPGHPDQYEIYYASIKLLLETENIYVMGICLGHQIMARIKGKKVAASHQQMHGQSIEIEFKEAKILVQRYNSLAVFDNSCELDICTYKNGVSYQFHPESIGTQQNDIFFKDLLDFIGTK